GRLRRRAHEGPRHPAVDRRPRPRRHQDEAAPGVLRGRRGPRPRGLRPRSRRGLREVAMNRFRRMGLLPLALAAALGRPPSAAAAPPSGKTENVVAIVTDGLRWQEVCRGAETAVVSEKPGGVEDVTATKAAFWRPTAAERREVLLPFVWSVVAK